MFVRAHSELLHLQLMSAISGSLTYVPTALRGALPLLLLLSVRPDSKRMIVLVIPIIVTLGLVMESLLGDVLHDMGSVMTLVVLGRKRKRFFVCWSLAECELTSRR